MGTFAVQSKSISRWIRAGLWALPVSWLVTAWSTLDPQPDQAKDPEAWARFVSSDAYQISHLFGSTAGTILALFGFFALGCSMANSRTGSLAIASMVTAVAGTALLLVPAVISTFCWACCSYSLARCCWGSRYGVPTCCRAGLGPY
ncbi:hypothetical protein [Pseudarthrobacter raffinosi]|uniref:hypothetical protein n=1 Tax=Pseudarthrobacter raffinosi TaxID=2953651 RepID=UPI00208FDC85|nr:hypothetical protein [Pseudarthrobacter sp. MDT3-28]MCO4237735.1 hypothetical protein [Pseudarthrobacter sp. MDT3-28]